MFRIYSKTYKKQEFSLGCMLTIQYASATQKKQVTQAISIVARTSTSLNLTLYPRKSGILRLYRKTPKDQAQGQIGGIPLVNEYKYLGTALTRLFSSTPHLAKAGRSITYISRKLLICRKQLDLSFSTNMFKMFLLPSVKMIASLHQQIPTQQKKIEIQVRRHYKSFCMLPWSSPNELIELLIGDIGKLIEGIARSADHKANCRRNGQNSDLSFLNSLKQSPIARYAPQKFTRLITALWGSKCQEHRHTMTRTHLFDLHGLQIDPIALLKYCQESKSDEPNQIKKLCWQAIQQVKLISERKVTKHRGSRKRTRIN